MRETGAQEIVVNPREQAGFEEADGSLVFDFFLNLTRVSVLPDFIVH